MQDLFKLNRYFKKYKGTVLLGTLFLTLGNVFLVWIPILVRKSIDDVQHIVNSTNHSNSSVYQISVSSTPRPHSCHQRRLSGRGCFMYGLLLFLTRQTLIVTSRRIEYDIRNEIFDHLQKLPQHFYSRWNSGDIYVRATEDVMHVREYFGPGFMYTVNTVSRAGIIIVIMLVCEYKIDIMGIDSPAIFIGDGLLDKRLY